MQNNNIRFNKAQVLKAERNRKNHISFLARNHPLKIKIIALAQKIAVSKIGRLYKQCKDRKIERQKIEFERKMEEIKTNLAKATIKKHV